MLFMPRLTSASPSLVARDRMSSPSSARLLRLGCGVLLLCAQLAAPSTSAAQDLPQGYATDAPAAAGEDTPSAPAPMQLVQDGPSASATLVIDEYEDTDPSALVEFEQPLAPYGTWVDDANYGRVWVPSVVVVGADFAPYQTAGRWSLTDEGEWLWVSDYSWGYIPFHYGRWVWIHGRGWAWIPGRVYAPAWVVWRVGADGYVGWAPMPPTYTWRGGVAVSLWTVPPAAYVFCPTTYVFHHHVHRHVIRDRAVVRRVAAHSHPYRPAQPTAVSPGRTAARPAGAAHGLRPASYRPASPSLAEAGVPSSAAPRERSRPDPRAIALARRSTSPGARTLPSPSRGGITAAAPSGRDRSAAPGLRSPRPHDAHIDRRTDRPSIPVPRAGVQRDASGPPAASAPHARPATPAAPAPHARPATPAAPAPHARPATPATPAPHARPATPAAPAPHARPATPAAPAPRTLPAPSAAPAPRAVPAPRVLPHSRPATPRSSAPHVRPHTVSTPSPARPRVEAPPSRRR